jgi:hypothetical protein
MVERAKSDLAPIEGRAGASIAGAPGAMPNAAGARRRQLAKRGGAGLSSKGQMAFLAASALGSRGYSMPRRQASRFPSRWRRRPQRSEPRGTEKPRPKALSITCGKAWRS